MKKLLLIGLLVITSGCAKIQEIVNNDTTQEPKTEEQEDTSEKTLSCSNEAGESAVFHAKGDEIQRMTQTTFLSYEELGINGDEVNKEAIQERINQGITDKYQGLAGVSVMSTMGEERIEITVDIDYTVADQQALIDAGLLDEGERQNQYVSLKKTEEVYKQNFACEIQ